MKIGLVGLPGAGKSTIFAAMTSERSEDAAEYGKSVAKVVPVPDPRLERLRDVFNPRKFTLATVEAHDFPGLDSTALKGTSQMFAAMREMEAVAVVLRAFEDPNFPHDPAAADTARDWDRMLTEFQISDLEMIERRVEKLDKAVLKPSKTQERDKKELELLKRLQVVIDEGGRLATFDMKASDEELLASFRFLTRKPTMAIVNLHDDRSDGGAGETARLVGRAEKVLALRGRLEAEIAQLPAEEAEAFMQDFAISVPARVAMMRELFDLLGLHSFFTVGEDEVRAWTIRKGDTAHVAAGKIHSDIQRGFIRAEVMAYEAFIAAGDPRAAKAAGVMTLEGKDYVVRDGDIINFRFSV